MKNFVSFFFLLFIINFINSQWIDGQRIFYKFNDGSPIVATFGFTGSAQTTCSCPTITTNCVLTFSSGKYIFTMYPSNSGTCTLSTDQGTVFTIAVIGNIFST
jgi:hypothetical protein